MGVGALLENRVKGSELKMQVNIQELYTYLEDCAFADGVNGVGEWIRDKIQEQYDIVLEFDPDIEKEG